MAAIWGFSQHDCLDYTVYTVSWRTCYTLLYTSRDLTTTNKRKPGGYVQCYLAFKRCNMFLVSSSAYIVNSNVCSQRVFVERAVENTGRHKTNTYTFTNGGWHCLTTAWVHFKSLSLVFRFSSYLTSCWSDPFIPFHMREPVIRAAGTRFKSTDSDTVLSNSGSILEWFALKLNTRRIKFRSPCKYLE